MLTSAVWADGLVDNPPGQAIARGDTVRFLPLAALIARDDMRCSVRYFASLREALGRRARPSTCAGGTTLGALRDRLLARGGAPCRGCWRAAAPCAARSNQVMADEAAPCCATAPKWRSSRR